MQITAEVQLTKTGEQTLKVNGLYIHSKYDPKREAAQIASKHYTPHYAHVIFGYGCGHVVEALKQVRQFNEAIIVIDPLFDVQIIDKPANAQNVYYFTTAVLEHLELYLGELTAMVRVSYKTLCLANYDKLFADAYKHMLVKVKDVQNRHLVNDHTVLKFSEIWYRNFLENMVYLATDYSGKVLEQRYTEAAVIVSGGPSLMKQIALMKRYRKHLIVICAGSTINSLLAEGIEPDYVTTIDGGDPNYQHFKDIHLKHAKVVYTMQSHPAVRRSFEKSGYAVESKGYTALSRYIKEELQVELPLFTGGASVAHTAFAFAQLITSGPIALIGQDLAYTDNLTHAKSNKYAREIDAQFIEEKQAFKVEGYDGEPIWTSPVLNSMRLEFEDIVKVSPPINTFFNCTEGGAKIHGYEQLAFKAFCEQYSAEQPVQIIEHEAQAVQYDVVQKFEKELYQYKELKRILEDAVHALENNRFKHQHHFDDKTLKKLNKADKKINKVVNELTLETLISPTVVRVMRSYLPKVAETKEETYARSYEQMKDLYTSLLKHVNMGETFLKELIEKRKEHE